MEEYWSVARWLASDTSMGAREIALRLIDLALKATSSWLTTAEIFELVNEVIGGHREMVILQNIGQILKEVKEKDYSTLRAILLTLKVRLVRAEEAIADNFTSLASRERIRSVITLSWSSTAYRCLTKGVKEGVIKEIYVQESYPLGEGLRTARMLGKLNVKIHLIPDSNVAHYARFADALLVGCDAILSDGSIVNKAGTFTSALAMKYHGKPSYIAAELLKVNINDSFPGLREVSEHDFKRYVVFDCTPAELITSIVTEAGIIRPEEARSQALSSIADLLKL